MKKYDNLRMAIKSTILMTETKILQTNTGNERNALTDANINLQLALKDIEKANEIYLNL